MTDRIFGAYSEPAPKLSIMGYTGLAALFCLFWVVVHTLSHYVFVSYNSVYRKKNARDRTNYLSYSASMIHSPLCTLNSVIVTYFIW